MCVFCGKCNYMLWLHADSNYCSCLLLLHFCVESVNVCRLLVFTTVDNYINSDNW